MRLSEFRTHLSKLSTLDFKLPDGTSVPKHFHITEAGLTSKHFIDCGGTIRDERSANLQVWTSTDYEHRLSPEKLLKILSISQKLFGDEDLEMEVEYQTQTVGRYGLALEGGQFLLTPKFTDCLASDQCGSPKEKKELTLLTGQKAESGCCAPGGGCC
jgi:hypothetical protein